MGEKEATERPWRRLFDAVPGMAACVALDGRCLRLNAAYRAAFGGGERSSDAAPMLDELHGAAGGARLQPHLDRARSGESAEGEIELVALGRSLPFRIVCVPDGDAAGGVDRVLLFLTDLSERRAADALAARRAAEAARAAAELEAIVHAVAHDLREPLRMVASYGQLLARRHGASLDDEGREFLGFVADGGRRAQAMVTDLVAFGRIGRSARHEAVALGEAIDQALAPLRLPADGEARITRDAGLPTLWGDRRQLVQLLHQLIANALAFRGTELPCVHLSAQPLSRAWRIEVRDNGRGVEPRWRERVFGIFQRLPHPEGAAAGGNGIGLAVCRKIVERHGGHIGVEAAAGGGSIFWFTWPSSDETAIPTASSASSPRPILFEEAPERSGGEAAASGTTAAASFDASAIATEAVA